MTYDTGTLQAASRQLRRAGENFNHAIAYARRCYGGRYAAADAYRAYLVDSGQYVYTTGKPTRIRGHGWATSNMLIGHDDSHRGNDD